MLAAWGAPARPGFPRRGNGKGEIEFLAAAGCFGPLRVMMTPRLKSLWLIWCASFADRT